MKKTFISLIISVLTLNVFAQNTKVVDSPTGTVISNSGGTDIPLSSAILDVRSTNKGVLLPRMITSSRDAIALPQAGLLLYNTSTNQFNFHDGTAWQQAFFGNQWSVNGVKYYYNGGNVGIGTTSPNYPFEVIGDARFANRVAINDPTPDYNLDVNGNAGIENLGVGVAPDPAYLLKAAGTANLANLFVPGTTTLNSTTNVNGTLNANGNLVVDGTATLNSTTNVNGTLNANGNLAVDGTATVNNGKGVAYNTEASTNLKIHHFTTPKFTAILGGHGRSAEGSLGFGGGFTQTPKVFVGDIALTGGTVGDLYMVTLQLYGCDTNSCKARLINHSPNPVNYDIYWNIMVIGY